MSDSKKEKDLIMASAVQLYRDGEFVMSIRYYAYKINLYRLDDKLYEVFYHHTEDKIEKIEELDTDSTRMKFYADQIRLPKTVDK
jgi:hypothetical protein